MKALILAAGRGSRLSPMTDDCPKALVPVNGTPILMRQVENLYENGIQEIAVVAGYQAERLETELHSRYPKVRILKNVDYAMTNNMDSAYRARVFVENDDFLMMNADVFFDSSVLKALLAFERANAIVTDVGRYLEESMKVAEREGRLIAISKAIAREDALGTSIDVYKFSSAAGSAFFKRCEEYIEKQKNRSLWSEVALNDILSEVSFEACPLHGRWCEIDTPEDLAEAEKIFAEA